MAVASAGRAAFNGRVGRNGIRPGVAFGRIVGKHHRHARLAALHHHVRDADGRAFPQARSKVGGQAAVQADAGDQVVGVGVHRARADVGVPRVVGRKRHRADQRGVHAQRSSVQIAVTGGARCRCWRRSRRGRRGSGRPGCRAGCGVGAAASPTGSHRYAQADDGDAAIDASKARSGCAQRRFETSEGERHAAPFVQEARSMCCSAALRVSVPLRTCSQTYQRSGHAQAQTTNLIAPCARSTPFLAFMALKRSTIKRW